MPEHPSMQKFTPPTPAALLPPLQTCKRVARIFLFGAGHVMRRHCRKAVLTACRRNVNDMFQQSRDFHTGIEAGRGRRMSMLMRVATLAGAAL